MDLQAALERIEEQEDELRRYAGEIRRLQYIVRDVDRFAEACAPYDDSRPATWTGQGLRNRLAVARRHAHGQGPDGPGATYPVRLDGWCPGMPPRAAPPPAPPELPELRELRRMEEATMGGEGWHGGNGPPVPEPEDPPPPGRPGPQPEPDAAR